MTENGTNAMVADEYFQQSKATKDRRHKRYLLDQARANMGPIEASMVDTVNAEVGAGIVENKMSVVMR